MKLHAPFYALVASIVIGSTIGSTVVAMSNNGKEEKETKEATTGQPKWAITVKRTTDLSTPEPLASHSLSDSITVASAADSKSAHITITIAADSARDTVLNSDELIRNIASFLSGDMQTPNASVVAYIEDSSLHRTNKTFRQALQSTDVTRTLKTLFSGEASPAKQEAIRSLLACAFSSHTYHAAQQLLEAIQKRHLNVSVFRFDNGNTVLHLAAQANQPDLYNLIRDIAPELHDLTNSEQKYPISSLSPINQFKVTRKAIKFPLLIPFALALLLYLVPSLQCGDGNNLQELGDVLITVLFFAELFWFKRVKRELHIKYMSCNQLLAALGIFITTIAGNTLIYVKDKL